MKMISVRPAAVGVSPITFCRYCGRKILSPTIDDQPNACALVAKRTSRLRRIAIGISGSGAVVSRRTNSSPTTAASANSARIGGEVQG